MRVKTSSLIKGIWVCLLLLSFVSVLHAADDTRFTFKEGVIDDSELGLQWVPAKQAMNYRTADYNVRNLSLAGGGWRLPTIAELRSLYDKSKPGNADPVFNIDKDRVWTSELDAPMNAWYFDFRNGKESSFNRDPNTESQGIFSEMAVRSRR